MRKVEIINNYDADLDRLKRDVNNFIETEKNIQVLDVQIQTIYSNTFKEYYFIAVVQYCL